MDFVSSDPILMFRVGTIEILDLERVCVCMTCKHFGRKKPCKSLISTLDKVIYCVGTFLQGST
jgi:hypothetical protein